MPERQRIGERGVPGRYPRLITPRMGREWWDGRTSEPTTNISGFEKALPSGEATLLASPAGFAPAADTIFAVPIWIFVEQRFDRLVFQKFSGGDNVVRMALYDTDPDNYYPGALLDDPGVETAPVATSKFTQTFAGGRRWFHRGLYWLAIWFSATGPLVVRGFGQFAVHRGNTFPPASAIRSILTYAAPPTAPADPFPAVLVNISPGPNVALQDGA